MKSSCYSQRLPAALLLFFISTVFLLHILLWTTKSARSLTKNLTEAQPDIIFIVVDSLRADHVSSYGYQRETTPNLDAWIADQGVLFTDATAASSWTNPSNAAMLTSRSSSAIDNVWTNINSRVPAAENMLAEYLHDEGYFTAGFVSNWWLRAGSGYDQGFDVYQSTSGAYRSRAEALNDLARGWMDANLQSIQNGDQPLFLFLYYLDPHSWYDPPAPYDIKYDGTYTGTLTAELFGNGEEVVAGNMALSERDIEHLIALYDGEINYWDHELGLMLSYLEQEKVLDDTIIVVTSDHGEMFGEHGKWVHGNSLYEEVLRIPLLISYPEVVTAKQVHTAPVHLMDIAPTLLHMVGIAVPPHMQGTTLLPIMQGSPAPQHRLIVSEMAGETDPDGLTYWIAPHTPMYSVRQDGYKLIHTKQAPAADELYLLRESSVYEQNNLAAEEAETVNQLFGKMQDYFGVPDRFLFLPVAQSQ